MSVWGAVLLAFGFGAWSILMLLVGAGIMKSAYTVPSDTKGLDR